MAPLGYDTTAYGAYSYTTPYGQDINGDGNPDPTHLVYINRDKIGLAKDARLDITLVHELLHMVQGEYSPQQDFDKFGVTGGTHTAAFDKVAAKFLALTNDEKIVIGDRLASGSISSHQGDSASNYLAADPAARGSFIDGLAGDDILNFHFGDSIVDGGDGNDTYQITRGSGTSVLFDTSGADTIDFGSAVNVNQIVIKRDADWIEISVNYDGTPNATIATVDNSVLVKNDTSGISPIESIKVGGVLYSLDYLLQKANTAPFITSDQTLRAPSTYRGGWLAQLSATDLDNDSVSFSIVGHSGYGSAGSWYIANGAIYTGDTAPRGTAQSQIVVRASDGKNFSDTQLYVVWTPRSGVATDSVPADQELSPFVFEQPNESITYRVNSGYEFVPTPLAPDLLFS